MKFATSILYPAKKFLFLPIKGRGLRLIYYPWQNTEAGLIIIKDQPKNLKWKDRPPLRPF